MVPFGPYPAVCAVSAPAACVVVCVVVCVMACVVACVVACMPRESGICTIGGLHHRGFAPNQHPISTR